MGEFYHNNRAVPGETLFTIVDRCSDGYILNRPYTFGTQYTIAEATEKLKALGIEQGKSEGNFFELVHGNDLGAYGGECEYVDGTVPAQVIHISFAEVDEWVDEYGCTRDESPLGDKVLEVLNGYDEYSDEYEKLITEYLAKKVEEFQPYLNKMKEAIKKQSKNVTGLTATEKKWLGHGGELSWRQDGLLFSISWNYEEADWHSMFFSMKTTGVQTSDYHQEFWHNTDANTLIKYLPRSIKSFTQVAKMKRGK